MLKTGSVSHGAVKRGRRRLFRVVIIVVGNIPRVFPVFVVFLVKKFLGVGFRLFLGLFERLSDQRLRARSIRLFSRSPTSSASLRRGAESGILHLLDNVLRHPDNDILVVGIEGQQRRRRNLSQIVGVPNDFRLPIAEHELFVVYREDRIPGGTSVGIESEVERFKS